MFAVEQICNYSIFRDQFLTSDEWVHTTRTEYKRTRQNSNNPCRHVGKKTDFCGETGAFRTLLIPTLPRQPQPRQPATTTASTTTTIAITTISTTTTPATRSKRATFVSACVFKFWTLVRRGSVLQTNQNAGIAIINPAWIQFFKVGAQLRNLKSPWATENHLVYFNDRPRATHCNSIRLTKKFHFLFGWRTPLLSSDLMQ